MKSVSQTKEVCITPLSSETKNRYLQLGTFIIAGCLTLLMGSLLKYHLLGNSNRALFLIAVFLFIGLTARIFGEGKGNKVLAFIFWTVCLLMIVDIRVTTLTDVQDHIVADINLRTGTPQQVAVVTHSLESKEDLQAKIDAALQCFTQCDEEDMKDISYLTDKRTLENHYYNILDATKSFRPPKRRKRTIYKDYLGPRLEDHFIHQLISERFSTFNPIVPLFVQWTEVYYSKAGGGIKKLLALFDKLLRKDVVYFTVASCETHKLQEELESKGFTVIFASSKGDPSAQIILPHLFRYNAPGFDENGVAIFDDIKYQGIEIDYDYSFSDLSKAEKYVDMTEYKRRRAYHDKIVRMRELNDIVPSTPEWRFKNYSSFFSMHEDFLKKEEQQEVFETLPEHKRFTFVGNLRTHHGRSTLVKALENDVEDFMYKVYSHNEQCLDYSAGKDHSSCWRTLMLSSGITLAPVGTAPVSYRMYEALQMGLPLMYIHDDRGAFIPYKGTAADVRNFGFVVNFEEAEAKIKELASLSESDFEAQILDMRSEIAKFRDTHFTPHGTIGQIKKWLVDPSSRESDLRCCTNPIGSLL